MVGRHCTSISYFQRTSVPFFYFFSSWLLATSTSSITSSICSPTSTVGMSTSEALLPPRAYWNWPRSLTSLWASRYKMRKRSPQSSPASSGCWMHFMCCTSIECLLPPRQKDESMRMPAPHRSNATDRLPARLGWVRRDRHGWDVGQNGMGWGRYGPWRDGTGHGVGQGVVGRLPARLLPCAPQWR